MHAIAAERGVDATMHGSIRGFRRADRRCAAAQRVVVLTGAGVSAESGVPTFRDALTGLWAKFDPRELATPSAFARNPKLVWDWYASRRAQVRDVEPNAGHVAIARARGAAFPQFLLATQNVDGLHARAGSRELVELHGNIARVRCSREDRIVERWDEPADALPPRCPRAARSCGRTSSGSRRCCPRTRSSARKRPRANAIC